MKDEGRKREEGEREEKESESGSLERFALDELLQKSELKPPMCAVYGGFLLRNFRLFLSSSADIP